jgi:hypothetical protein
VAWKYRVQSCQLNDLKKKRKVIIPEAVAIKNVTSKHLFLLKISALEGRNPERNMAELERVKGVYDDIRARDQVVTLSLFSRDLQLHNVSLKELSA